MPTFITLIEYTAEGVQNMDQSPSRLEAAKEVVSSMGGDFHTFYLTMGQYDAIAVMDMPDAESATQAAITISGAGAVRTETFRAFPEAEYRDLVAGLP